MNAKICTDIKVQKRSKRKMNFFGPGAFGGGGFIQPPSGGDFNFETISDLALWFYSDENTTLDTVSTTTVSDWGNKAAAGSKYDLTQATKTHQPLYATNEINGYPALQFDGAGDCLGISGSGLDLTNNVAGFTIAMVVKPDSLGDTPYFLSSGNASSGQLRAQCFHFGADGKMGLIGQRPDGTGAQINETTGSVITSDFQILIWNFDYDNTDASCTLDGSIVASSTSWLTGSGNTDSTDSNMIFLARGGFGNYANINVAALLGWQRSLSTSEEDTVTTELASRYAITV